MPSIHILADDRESQSTVIEALRHHEGVEVTVSRLELGDYLLKPVKKTCINERNRLLKWVID